MCESAWMFWNPHVDWAVTRTSFTCNCTVISLSAHVISVCIAFMHLTVYFERLLSVIVSVADRSEAAAKGLLQIVAYKRDRADWKLAS